MGKFWYRVWSWLLTRFGEIKVFPRPLWLVSDPSEFRVSGPYKRMVDELLRPGDIILRGYDHYLDGKFVPGNYSHGGLYVGHHEVIHVEAPCVKTDDVFDFIDCDRVVVFRPVSGKKKAVQRAWQFYLDKIPYDFSYKAEASALYCFELCAFAYEELAFKTHCVSYFLGLVKREAYTCESFFESDKVQRVFEYNPKAKEFFNIGGLK